MATTLKIKRIKNRKLMGIIILSLSIIIGTFIILVIGAMISSKFVYTPSFKDNEGKIIHGSIAEFKRIKLGKHSHGVLIRGKNLDNPMVLFLHCGPGVSETGMMRNKNAALEDHFTMVYMDQRGGGKSYSPFMDYKTFNTEQLVQDIHELTLYLKKRFKKNKIMILGHSFGAGFGAMVAANFPEDYSAIYWNWYANQNQ